MKWNVLEGVWESQRPGRRNNRKSFTAKQPGQDPTDWRRRRRQGEWDMDDGSH